MKKLLTFAILTCVLFSFFAMTASATLFTECICDDCCCDCIYYCACEPVICPTCEVDIKSGEYSNRQPNAVSRGYLTDAVLSLARWAFICCSSKYNIPTIVADNVRLNN